MNYLLILFTFSIFFTLVYLDRFYADWIVRKEIEKLKNIQNKLVSQKFTVSCSNFTSGRKSLGFHYRYADLYFNKDAFIIVGYYFFFTKKVYRSFLVLTNQLEYYKTIFNKADEVIIPKQLNTNSINGDVYIEFGEAGFTSTSVTITLKNLSESDKMLIKI